MALYESGWEECDHETEGSGNGVAEDEEGMVARVEHGGN